MFGIEEKLIFAGIGYAYAFSSEGYSDFSQAIVVVVDDFLCVVVEYGWYAIFVRLHDL